MPFKSRLIFYTAIAVFLSWSVTVIIQSCSGKKADFSKRPADLKEVMQLEYDSMMAIYVGSEACLECHEPEYNDWLGSHHDKSMMLADEASVYGDFENVTFSSQGVTSRFYKVDGKYFVNTEGPDGSYRDYEILYTFGFTPLQQYIIEFPKGNFQCLRTAWDTEEKKWFDLYPDMKIVHDEWLHWTKGGLSWNIMCSDCHSTLVKKDFDEVSESYNTTFSIINVSCEACHGPARQHMDIVKSESYDETLDSGQYDHGMYLNRFTKPREMVDQCARCHSLRTQFTDFYDHKGLFMDHYAPDVLRDGIYHADGQILGEVYVYGSFLQSKMYRMNVKCNDCHNVHSVKLKLEGNALCNQCHVKEKYDVYEHHFHEINTEGAECVSCHMIGRYYMVNDYRRDHSFRIPRPDLSVKYGTPNACNDCHDDQSYQWSDDYINQWYGPDRPYHFSETLAFARTRDPGALSSLIKLADSVGEAPMARATALWYLSQFPDQQATDALIRQLNDADPFLRYTSANSLAQLPQQVKSIVLTPMLNDPVRSVRIAAVSSMAGVPDNLIGEQSKIAFAKANEEFLRGLSIRADFPGGQMEKAYYYERLGQTNLAELAYVKAIEIDNYYNAARINLAGLYYGQQRFEEAEELFKKVIEQEPQYGQAYYSLGLLLAEQNKMLEAVKYLGEASKLMNYNDRVSYNYGLVLQKLGKREEAEQAFLDGIRCKPGVNSQSIWPQLSLF